MFAFISCCGRWGLALLLLSCVNGSGLAGDYPMWGGTASRNMVSEEKGLPPTVKDALPSTNKVVSSSGVVRLLWTAELGSQTFGTPVVAEGRVYIGTNNARPRDARFQGDRGVLLCLREADGALLWQLAVPKIPSSGLFNGDRSQIGICSTPVVEHNRIYVVTNRCELLCLDVNGQADGNDGPFLDEGIYLAAKTGVRVIQGEQKPEIRETTGAKVALTQRDADIIWRLDMISAAGSWPQDASDCSPLIYGDTVFVSTSNGICKSHRRHALYPDTPSLLAVDKRSGAIIAADQEKIGERIWHGQWSSPSMASLDSGALLLYGAGDGVCYAFDANIKQEINPPCGELALQWAYDCNPLELRMRNGLPIRYNSPKDGPSEIIATPVIANGKAYIAIGQDPSHGSGPGCLSCIDLSIPSKADASRRCWEFREIGRSVSTVAVWHNLVFAADVGGIVYCLDAESGKLYWKQKTGAELWASPVVADGKVYLGSTNGTLWVFAAEPECRVLSKDRFSAPIFTSVVAANHKLFVATSNRLYVFESKSKSNMGTLADQSAREDIHVISDR